MQYNDEYRSVFNSELAVKVLRIIGSSERGDYGSRIAKKLGKSQASISRVLGNLRDLGFVEKTQRQKAQYYRIEYQRIGDFWYNYVYEKLEESDKEVHRKKWMVDEYTDKDEILEGFENNREEIVETIAGYSREVFEGASSLHNLTVSQILFQQFGLSIGHNMINQPGFLERNSYLEYPKDALIHLWNMEGFSRELNTVVEGKGSEEVVVKRVRA